MSGTPEVEPYRPPQRLGSQALIVGGVALLCLLFFRLAAAPVVLLGLLTFADAWRAGIHRTPGRKGFLNVSAAGWGVAVMLAAAAIYPVYVLYRSELRTRPGSSVLFVLVNVAGCLLIGYLVLQAVVLFTRST